MNDVDRIVLRLRGNLGEYDGDVGGFVLRDFQSDRFIPIGSVRFLFDNHREFVTWKLATDAARTVVSKAGYSRSILLEISAKPFAAGHGSADEVRMQILNVRITTDDGRLLGELSSKAPEADVIGQAAPTVTALPANRLDVLGLKVGSTPAAYHAWAKTNGFEAHMVEEPFRYDWPSRYAFTAVVGGLPRRSTQPLPPEPENYPPLPIVGRAFTCGAKVDAQMLCGTVVFSGEPKIDDKRITTIQMAQSVVGRSDDEVEAKLTDKYGPMSESFDVVVTSAERAYRGRQLVWGSPFSTDTAPDGVVSFSKQRRNWPIEAVVFEPDAHRTVVLVQVTTSPTSAGSPKADVRF